MANTFMNLGTVTVGSGGSSTIAFSSIPSTFTDLYLVASLRMSSTGTGNGASMSLNGTSASTNADTRGFFGDSALARSNTGTTLGIGAVDGSTETANVFSIHNVYFSNYTSSNYKSICATWATEENGSNVYIGQTSQLWSNTAVINSITLTGTSSFVQYSTATLYGIKNS